MAAVVPFLVNAGLGAIGITGVAATIASVATSVVFQVSGINDKINKAASKVFGEDLVNVANIAGAVYGAWNGGFSLDPAKEFLGIGEAASGMSGAADAAAAMNVPTGIESGAAFESHMTGLGQTPTNVFGNIGVSGEGAAQQPVAGTQPASQAAPPQAPTTTTGTSLTTPQVNTDPRTIASKYDLVPSNAAGSSAAASNATSVNATGINATASGIGLQAPGNALAAQPSVFDKLLSKVGDKTIAGVIQGGATAAGNYMTAQDRLKAEEQARRINPSTRRGYTYKAA